MIYRALKMRTYASSMTSAELQDEFLGTGSAFHAPAYHVHDMSSGADMQHNIVLRNNPFYFAPTVYPQYKDADGNGYHVIHFLDDILPYTGGWINLLQTESAYLEQVAVIDHVVISSGLALYGFYFAQDLKNDNFARFLNT